MSDIKLCACGCGREVKNTYARGHHPRSEETRKKLSLSMIGNKSGCAQKSRTNDIIVGDARNYIDGLLLSDGYITARGPTGYYGQICKNDFWIEKIHNDFLNFGIESSVTERYVKDRFIKNSLIKGGYYSVIRTLSYIEFDYMKYRWYLEGKKIVPRDIILVPECVANWYLGDGSISKVKPNGYSIALATYGFSVDDVMFLSDKLNDILEINSYVTKNNVIKIGNKQQVSAFIDYIKDYNVIGYDYKFPEICEY